MPELPEVEVTRAALAPLLIGATITGVHLRIAKLRHPISSEIFTQLPGNPITALDRRGKYLLLGTPAGTALIHLGMTGHLRSVPAESLPGPYDHLDISLDNNTTVRFNDPRRFGLMLWAGAKPLTHPLLADLGPEPLTDEFSADYFSRKARQRSVAVKPFIMDAKIVVGIGNIYASESLFVAGINPSTPVGILTSEQITQLVSASKQILTTAINHGGTTPEHHVNTDSTDYFPLRLAVYQRHGQPCLTCGTPIQKQQIGQRSSFYCPTCQP